MFHAIKTIYKKIGWGIALALILLSVGASGGAEQSNASESRAAALLRIEGREWSAAENHGWKRRGDGVTFGSESVRIVSGGTARSGRAEVAYPHVLDVPERFAITFRARFHKLGLEDDDTGEKSFWRLTVGATTPQGKFGLGFLFTGDRYKVDTQYKVVRTDTEWHTWRFEADAFRKTVTLYRDGAYVCLHQAGSRQPNGARIYAQGLSSLPADVEIAQFAIEAMPAPPSSSPRSPHKAAEWEAGEWPLWRRDPQNTALSPMKGAIRKPRLVWQHSVGNITPPAVFLDLDGDGTKEALISHGGNLTAYRLNGTRFWQMRKESATVYGVYDLDGDGEEELVLAAGSPSLFHVADAKTGRIRYVNSRYPMAGVAGVRIAKLNPKNRGLQAVVWSPQHEIGFCLSFAKGVEKALVAWEFNWRVTNFSPAVLLADMDRNGTLDVVVNTYDRTFVFDGDNGRKKMDLKWPAGRNYGTTVVQDIDGDGYPDVVTLADYLREHIGVLKNEGGKSLRFLWDNFYEQNYPDDFKTLRLLAESVGDFDGDGKTEIAGALFDSVTDSVWQTFLLDARTGKVKQTIPGRYLVGAGPLFPGRPPVLLLSKPDNRADLNLNRLAVWAFRDGGWREQAALPEGTLLPAASLRDFAPNVWSTVHLNTTALRPLSAASPQLGLFLARTNAAGEQTIEFLTGEESGRLATRWKAGLRGAVATQTVALSGETARPRRNGLAEQVAGRVMDVAEILPGKGEPQLVAADADGALRILRSETEVYGTIRPWTGFITQPVAARLRKGERPSLLYIDANGDLVCLRSDTDGGQPQVQWTQPAVGNRPRMVSYLDAQGVPVLADLDGDGEREILVARKPNQLVALDPDGKVKQTWTLPALPVQWAVGDFDDDARPDLFVTWPSGAFVDMESGILSGKDGKMLWKAKCGNGPPALFDFNADGREDILLRDLFERRTLNAATGRDILPITMWAGYHTPVILPLKGANQPPGVVWIGGAYSLVVEGEVGKQSWWKPFRATGPQAVADVDNDGRYEIGGVTAGQLYNWSKFYAVGGPDKEFLCYDALTGSVKWTYPLGATASGVIAADVDGDGNLEYLLGTADGRLLALRGGVHEKERVLWEMSFPAAVGPMIVCDVNGDGAMSLLVSCADGNLYCIR